MINTDTTRKPDVNTDAGEGLTFPVSYKTPVIYSLIVLLVTEERKKSMQFNGKDPLLFEK
jgi:hypothetical protein